MVKENVTDNKEGEFQEKGFGEWAQEIKRTDSCFTRFNPQAEKYIDNINEEIFRRESKVQRLKRVIEQLKKDGLNVDEVEKKLNTLDDTLQKIEKKRNTKTWNARFLLRGEDRDKAECSLLQMQQSLEDQKAVFDTFVAEQYKNLNVEEEKQKVHAARNQKIVDQEQNIQEAHAIKDRKISELKASIDRRWKEVDKLQLKKHKLQKDYQVKRKEKTDLYDTKVSQIEKELADKDQRIASLRKQLGINEEKSKSEIDTLHEKTANLQNQGTGNILQDLVVANDQKDNDDFFYISSISKEIHTKKTKIWQLQRSLKKLLDVVEQQIDFPKEESSHLYAIEKELSLILREYYETVSTYKVVQSQGIGPRLKLKVLRCMQQELEAQKAPFNQFIRKLKESFRDKTKQLQQHANGEKKFHEENKEAPGLSYQQNRHLVKDLVAKDQEISRLKRMVQNLSDQMIWFDQRNSILRLETAGELASESKKFANEINLLKETLVAKDQEIAQLEEKLAAKALEPSQPQETLVAKDQEIAQLNKYNTENNQKSKFIKLSFLVLNLGILGFIFYGLSLLPQSYYAPYKPNNLLSFLSPIRNLCKGVAEGGSLGV